jgi:murein DD-endopeptidase MepM/ murein hydrolase activator NlpD
MVAKGQIGIALMGFTAGVLVMALSVQVFPEVVSRLLLATSSPVPMAVPKDAVLAPAPSVSVMPTSSAPAAPSSSVPPASPSGGGCPPKRKTSTEELPRTPTADEATADLRRRRLDLPLPGLTASDLHDSFSERRGTGRAHEAIDIAAARNTPVRAVEDGCIAKLFFSKAGGRTIYQFDSSFTYAYYYAHLERYAKDLDDGDTVRRGDVIGYVGTSGNAPPDVPHLHFGIFVLTPERRWWQGAPIDPFRVWR